MHRTETLWYVSLNAYRDVFSWPEEFDMKATARLRWPRDKNLASIIY